MNQNVTVAFDVDGTLITQNSSLDTPRYDVIALFHVFERLGCDLYIWSGGGVDYAARWAEKLGLKANIVAKGSFKPDITIDDLDLDMREAERSIGRVNLQV